MAQPGWLVVHIVALFILHGRKQRAKTFQRGLINVDNLEVKLITRQQARDLIINKHYAARFPSVSYYFGLFDCGKLEGVCTFGTPSSHPLRIGIAGREMAPDLLELNRLCLYQNKKNHASFLVSRALKLIDKNKIIISFADTEQDHKGVVYQACNFSYHGLSAKRTDWKIKGYEHLHGQTVADEFRGMKNRSKLMREKYGDNFYLKDRPRKHRYIYIIGDKKYKKQTIKKIKYKKEDYPK